MLGVKSTESTVMPLRMLGDSKFMNNNDYDDDRRGFVVNERESVKL